MKQNEVYDFIDYREFLRLEIERLRATDEKLGYRGISKRMGLSSPNFIQLVIQGKRNLSVESARKCADLLELGQEEASFFVALVMFNQATSLDEKLIAQKQMYSVKGFLRARPIEAAQYSYFSDCAMVLVRELMSLKGFEADPKVIAEQLSGSPMTVEQVEKALKQLVELRLVDKSVEGKYFVRDAHVELPAGKSNHFVFAFHRAMMERSLWALTNLKAPQREVSASTLTFDSSKMKEAKEFLQKMETEFIAQFGSSSDADSVCQLNMQFFELAKISAAKKAA